MLPSSVNSAFREWGIDPMYGWDALELSLDDPILESIEDKDHLREILADIAITLINMAVDDDKSWSSYFTWALHIIDTKLPMTYREQTLCLGEAARYHDTERNRPNYLYVVQQIISLKPVLAK